MEAAISNTLIQKLKPSAKQYDVRDTKLTGFLIRVNPTGNMVYVCEYQRGRRINLGKVGVLTPAQAREQALEVLNNAAKGILPFDKNKSITLKQFIENEYKPWALAHRKAGLDAVKRIERCFYPSFSTKPLSDITPVLIDQWRTQRLKTGLNTEAINRDTATFKAALAKAVLWGFIDHHPLANLKLFKVDTNVKIRYLTDNEELQLTQALINREEKIKQGRDQHNEWREKRNYDLLPNLRQYHFADDLMPKILLSINTGMRRGELISLKWS